MERLMCNGTKLPSNCHVNNFGSRSSLPYLCLMRDPETQLSSKILQIPNSKNSVTYWFWLFWAAKVKIIHYAELEHWYVFIFLYHFSIFTVIFHSLYVWVPLLWVFFFWTMGLIEYSFWMFNFSIQYSWIWSSWFFLDWEMGNRAGI